jgi:2-polyprenyl-6-methoxyphenol hydroxylase-like FAD-dependent oxidoreductase
MLIRNRPGAQNAILTVGGGIGGLAAALALAQKGYRSHVLEQASEFKEIGAGIQLGPNVFKMFDILGLTDAVRRLATFPENLVMMDCVSGETVACIPLGGPFVDRFKHPYALIHRADLLNVLLDACRSCDRISLETSRQVSSITDNGDHISISTSDGANYEGAALIGADGLWSTVRSILIGDGKPRISGHIAYRAVLPTEDVPAYLRRPDMAFWAGEKVHLVYYPIRNGQLTNLVAVFHSSRYEEGWDSYGDPAELHERFSAACEQARTLLSKIETWRMWVLCDREPIRQWFRGRVVLLGDAAHPMLQYLAQGGCMAVEDAVCLADQLERSNGHFESAFQAYNDARYLRTARAQLMARLYGEVYHAAGVAREVRNKVLSAWTPRDAYEGLSWIYDGV